MKSTITESGIISDTYSEYDSPSDDEPNQHENQLIKINFKNNSIIQGRFLPTQE